MKLINLPNILTCCNLLCGCLAIYNGLNFNLDSAATWIILGAVFDFFDGMTARALGISGPIGKELDSLADGVTFGVAPSVLAYLLLFNSGRMDDWALLAFLMAAFSALRLAKFNCDERQTSSFIGLPTPANALFWIGLSYLYKIPALTPFFSPWIVYALLAVLSVMLICELPMFSLKFKKGHTGWSDLGLQYTFLLLSAAIVVACWWGGQPMASLAGIILLYILMSLIAAVKVKKAKTE